MHWYKIALKINSLLERNTLNARIRLFKKMVMNLDYLTKYVFQNAAHAQKVVKDMAGHKTTSSFPSIRKALEEAASKCLDNYKEAAGLMDEAKTEIYRRIKDLEKERRDFVRRLSEQVKARQKND